ncbi:hypothetical protein FEM03_05525 [Phragmitibacter flavus]|uniref:Rad50/SbcC-type AAA domain-containing protein n=1 Tax=Phragmitibacter flavus TaxID=2576071 RepID=A0A5R8KH41_9BACT|nr:AAA family ATPase [Phragmitibacter flavus]TLD71602.1 hypothetical protein FEM03_05525 [Phragmitibacter flavus]
MRLLSITVKNYRIHQEVKVDFDAARTLIGGANESGKSTLVEAAHRVLFLKAKVTGKVLQGMKSTLHTDHPKVLLSFEAGGKVWEVEKRFSGASGQARLSILGGQSWHGEEAESKLAEVLGTDGSVSREKDLLMLWPHLWVWQGRSGDDPADQATEHRDALVQRLQSEGLAAVMQSDFDQRVKDRIAAAYEELFTATGKAKAGSKPEVARLRLEEMEAALLGAQEAAGRLEEAVGAFGVAESVLKGVDAVLPGLLKELKATQEKLVKVGDLRGLEKEQWRVVKDAELALMQLRKEEEGLRELRRQVMETETVLKPLEERLQELEGALKEAGEARQRSEVRHRELAEALRSGRARLDLAVALVAVFEKGEAREILAKRAAEAGQVAAEMNGLREALASLPNLAAAEVAKLRSLETDWQKAMVVRDATAAELMVLVSDAEEVRVDGDLLKAGEAKVLAEEVEISIGKGTRLRLRPGGGTSLAAARSNVEEAERKLREALGKWSARDVEQAVQWFEKAESLRHDGKRLRERWNGLGGEKVAADLEAAEMACRTAEAEMLRRKEGLTMDGETLPDSLLSARLWVKEMEGMLSENDKAEREARAMADEARVQLEKVETGRGKQLEMLTEKRQLLGELRLRMRVVEEKYADSAAREEAMSMAVRAAESSQSMLEGTRRLLAELQPELLERDGERLGRSVANQEQQRRTAETQMAVARSQLVLDGRVDPESDVQQARARVAEAREVFMMEQRRAKAVERLFQLFAESRGAIDRRLVQPLANRVSGYLQCVFGPGAELRVLVAEDGKLGFEISRSGGGGAFGFESLSGGAKEQVAAAVRLAMAEILATQHDGCLPLVFDDAFAYADPLRVQQMQRMLDLAATRGLQVVVLTCNPGDYAGFGGVEVRIG